MPASGDVDPEIAPAPQARLLDLINTYRARHGLAALIASPALARAAQQHSNAMVTSGFFDHCRPAGGCLAARLADVGYVAQLWAENIGAGVDDAAELMAMWRNSPGHDSNLLLADATEAGVGYNTGIVDGMAGTWTLVIARPLE